MEQTYEEFTQKFKCENEGREMDIEGNVIKVELKPPLTQIQKLPNVKLENAKQVEHNVEIKCWIWRFHILPLGENSSLFT